jgi:hypothetical protein
MFGPPVTLRCPSCGHLLVAPVPPTLAPAWIACPNCHRSLPVLRPRAPAPLFTWEAFPHLYPYLALPRPIGPRLRPLAAGLLIAVAVLLAVVAGGFVLQGGLALPDHAYRIAGHVVTAPTNGSAPAPLVGARVNLTGENGFTAHTLTDAAGGFSFARVPSGGVTINVTAPSFAPTEMMLFVDPVYSSPPGDPTNLTLELAPGNAGQGTVLVESAYPSLEQFVATLWSGGVVLAIAAIVAGAGAARTMYRERYAWGVAGGVAGALAPVALFELGVDTLFPSLELLAIGVAGAGLVVATLLTLLLAATKGPEPPDGVPPPPAE